MEKALIITGGYINFEKVQKICNGFSITIAADSGYTAARKLNIVPDIVLGDFDSLKEKISISAELIKVPAEKDYTDTMLACNVAIERGADELLILGGTGGRADHFLANIFFLESLLEKGVTAVLTDGENTVKVINDCTVTIENKGGYFSVFAIDTCTVTISGCKYPLDKFVLKRTNPFAVSNEVIGDCATVTVKGTAILCESQK